MDSITRRNKLALICPSLSKTARSEYNVHSCSMGISYTGGVVDVCSLGGCANIAHIQLTLKNPRQESRNRKPLTVAVYLCTVILVAV